MKKLIALLAAAAFVLSLATMASAAHSGRANLKTSGFIQTAIGTGHAWSEGSGDTTGGLRVRQYFDYIASENLKAVVAYEFESDYGTTNVNTQNDPGYIQGDIGGDNSGGDNDGANYGLAVKRANLQFTFPGTETQVKSGLIYTALPAGAIGTNPVFAADNTGATISSPVTDSVDLTFGWSRPMDTNETATGNEPGLDAFFAALPIQQDGFSLSPYFMYAVMGDDVDDTMWGGYYYEGLGNLQNGQPPFQDSANMYWVGTSFNLSMMDPMTVDGSVIYGSLQADNDPNDRSGWYADLSLKYKMEQITPEVYGWYGSGEDDDLSDGSETMPFIYNDGTTSHAPSIMVGDMTNFGVSTKNTANLQGNPAGLWSLGVALNHISLTDKLSSTLLAAYYQGTSDDDQDVVDNLGNVGNALTKEDSVWEVAMSANYQMYENLSAILETAYGGADMDDDLWGDDYMDENPYNVSFGVRYDF